MSPPTTRRSAVLCAALGSLVLAAPLAAAQTVRHVQVADVEISATYAWPNLLDEGWFPIHLSLRNLGAQPRQVHLEATGGSTGHVRVRAQIELAADGAGELELLCEAGRWGMSQYEVLARVGIEQAVLPALGPAAYPSQAVLAHLLVPAPGTASARVEHWRTALVSAGGAGQVLGSLSGPSALSRRPQAYSSLFSVVLDVGAGLPDGEQLAALSSWVRGGGRLVLYGEGAEALARAQPALASWMQERFRIPADEYAGLWRMGHGRLYVGGAEVPFDDEKQRDRLLEHRRPLERQPFELDLTKLPLRSSTVLLVLFAILIGPVNFILVKRSGRPTLLLVTVPAIALGASLLLVLYATLAQGMDVRSASVTYTVLDQRAALATTREVRAIFAGSSPGPGLRPEAGTTVMPPASADVRASFDRRHLVDLRQGTLLGGDYLKVRVEQEQRLVSERSSRARIEVRSVGDEVLATNALGAEVSLLWVCLADGSLRLMGGPLPAGEERSLIPMGGSDRPAIRAAHDFPWSMPQSLPPATWMAVLARSPFSDDLGLELREVAGKHMVFGILADAQEGR